MKGTEDQFERIVNELRGNIKNYEDKRIKYIQYLGTIDAVFAGYGWGKKDFYEELNKRLGIETNDSRREEKEKRKKELAAPVKPAKKAGKKSELDDWIVCGLCGKKLAAKHLSAHIATHYYQW